MSPSTPNGSARRSLLVVNADDFGMTAGVCTGILQAHSSGVVSSTSALVTAPAFDRFAPLLRDAGIGVGAHLSIVGEDPPLLSAREVPSLVDRRGRLPLRWHGVVRRALSGRLDPDDVRREFDAQLDKLCSTGIEPTHLDSHQNLHLWPAVASVVVELAGRRGIPALRLPRMDGRTPVAAAVSMLSSRLAERARAAELVYPAASLGLDEVPGPHVPGACAAVAGLVSSGVRSCELVVHLAEDPDPERRRYRSRFRWGEQLEAMCHPEVRSVMERFGVELGSFADLVQRPSAPRPSSTGTAGARS